jgi:predicted AlkP superfamily phosphohydrolase/phosphomutase
MKDKLAIIGIDSLDPYIILKYRNELPNLSKLIDESPTFISKSVFPVDTIPAWGSIYTGLSPGNHGLLYVYDVFDPKLSDLNRLDTNYIKGKTFWDHASEEGYKTVVLFPTLMYPAWGTSGIMISKSPFEDRVNWIKTERNISVYPEIIRDKYKIPDKLPDLWGGFPGINHLKEWAETGKYILNLEKNIGLEIYKSEDWDLFFIYYSLLDIIQHRLWRFFDHDDVTFPGKTPLYSIIKDYYKLFDNIIGEFIEAHPEIRLIVMSDHGHMSRPSRIININEYLRKNGYLLLKNNRNNIKWARDNSLKLITKLNLEHLVIKFVNKSQRIAKASKTIYSMSDAIDKTKSVAYLSNFAGIKSYPDGGIEINKNLVSDDKYEKIRDDLIKLLSELEGLDNEPLLSWVARREEVYPGKFTERIYPDILFELRSGYGVGWDINSDLFGISSDHHVASGGHRKDAIFLMKNVHRLIKKRDMSVIDCSPTILDLLGINRGSCSYDGSSILED